MKRVLKVLVVLAVIAAVGVIAAVVWIDRLAKTGIEMGATHALGVPTTLGSANIGLFSGRFALDELYITNPETFSEEGFLTLDHGEVAVSLRSLAHNTVRLSLLSLTGVHISLEHNGKKGNYDVVFENLQQDTPDETPDEPDPSTEEGGKKFVIDEVLVRDIAVRTQARIGNNWLPPVTFVIPEVRIRGLGSDTSNGVVLSQVTGSILQGIMKAVVSKGAELPEAILGGLTQNLGELDKLGKEVMVETQKALETTGQEAQQAVEAIGAGLENVLQGLGGNTKKKAGN